MPLKNLTYQIAIPMEPGTLTIRSVVLKTVLGTWLLSVVIDCTIAAVRENSAQFELARLA